MWWSSPRAAGAPGAWRALLLLVLAGCAGYTWNEPQGPPSGEGTRVALPAFTNETLEPNLGALMTGLVRTRLLQGGLVVTPDAALRLVGRVTSLSDEVLAFNAAGLASHRRVAVTVQLTLNDGAKVLWDKRPVIVSAEYPVTEDATANRDAKDRALEETAIQLADMLTVDLGAAAAGVTDTR
jgi:Lipopolysaccharide-assembly